MCLINNQLFDYSEQQAATESFIELVSRHIATLPVLKLRGMWFVNLVVIGHITAAMQIALCAYSLNVGFLSQSPLGDVFGGAVDDPREHVQTIMTPVLELDCHSLQRCQQLLPRPLGIQIRKIHVHLGLPKEEQLCGREEFISYGCDREILSSSIPICLLWPWIKLNVVASHSTRGRSR